MLTILQVNMSRYKFNSVNNTNSNRITVNTQNYPNFCSMKSIPELLGHVTVAKTRPAVPKITKEELEILDDCISYFGEDVYRKLNTDGIFGNENADKIYQNLVKNYNDIKRLVALLNSFKPSIILADKTKLLESGRYNSFDVVSKYMRFRDNSGSIFNTFILNPELCKPIINKYKSLFTSKINLPETCSIDNIYNSLLTSDSPLFRDDKIFADIRGLLLGFPEKSSILFSLENMLPNADYRNFSNIEKHRTLLREALNSEAYSGISKEIRKLAEEAISELTGKDYNTYTLSESKHGKIPGFDYIRFIPEPKEEERLIKAYRNTIEKLKELTAEERIEALLFS